MKYEELKAKLNAIDLKEEEVRLDVCTVIINPKKFLQSHLAIIDANRGNPRYRPYYDRLFKFYKNYESKEGKFRNDKAQGQ